MDVDKIRLFWARTSLEDDFLNFGDALSAVIVAGLSNKPIVHVPSNSNEDRISAIGTVGHNLTNGTCKVWGTGFDASINHIDKSLNYYTLPPDTKLEVLATRGRFSELLLQSQGVVTTGVYGDPGWFARYMVREDIEKQWELGIIVHISELETRGLDAVVKQEFQRYNIPDELKDDVKIIHTYTKRSVDGILDKIREIKSCKRILSTSLHGLVMAEMFEIPCAWFGMAKMGGVKTPLYVYASDRPLDHRVRDFYSGTSSHDYALTYHASRVEPFDIEDAIAFLDKEWVPIQFDDAPLFNAFPYLNIKHPNFINIDRVKKNLADVVL